MKQKKQLFSTAIFLGLLICIGGVFLSCQFNTQSISYGANEVTADGYWTDSANNYTTVFTGTGTKSDPYLITNEKELSGLAYNVNQAKNTYSNKFFKQTNDLNLSQFYWKPIGTVSASFQGTYDGNKHVISGVYTKHDTSAPTDYHGLFGYVSGAPIIKNLGMVDSEIKGYKYTGAIVGYGSNITMTNCYNTSPVSGGTYIGGIIGYFSGRSISNCYNTGKVTGGSNTNIGGIAGFAYKNYELLNCFNTGEVTGNGGFIGGVIGGYTFDNSDDLKSYYGGNCTLARGIGKSSSNVVSKIDDLDIVAKNINWYQNTDNWLASKGWDFVTVWKIDEAVNEGYPSFSNTKNWLDDETNYTTEFEGSGSISDPYLITNEKQLAGLSYKVRNKISYSYKYFKQTADLDMGKFIWTPIGNYVDYSAGFAGSYNGGGYSISGLNTDAATSDQGLFGYVSGSSSATYRFENIHVKDSTIQGTQYIGGIIGRITSNGAPEIINCSNAAKIVSYTGSTISYAGGIIGFGQAKSFLSGCVNSGQIIGKNYIGGIAGYNQNVANCINTGAVIGESFVGGIIGSATLNAYNGNRNFGTVSGDSNVGGISGAANNSSIIACYNNGDVTGKNNVGGICGASSNSLICNSYNTATIFCKESMTGGIVGKSDAFASCYNCINLGNVIGSQNAGGISGVLAGSSILDHCYYGGDCTLSVSTGDDNDATPATEDLYNLARDMSWYKNKENWKSKYPWHDSIWRYQAAENQGLPTISFVFWTDKVDEIDLEFEGSGTQADPYLISCAEELAGLAYNVNELNLRYNNIYFKQTCDIDMSAKIWVSIGSSYYHEFYGNYDGCGYTIRGLYALSGNYQALFGFPRVGLLQNINVKDSLFQGIMCGSIGARSGSTFKNCFSDAVLIGIDYVGGISASDGTIINSISNCDIFGFESYAGGITGSSNGSISNCIFLGTIRGAKYIGSICGYLTNSVKNCAGFGEIIVTGTALTYAGAITGYNNSSQTNITNCSFYGTTNKEIGQFYGSAAMPKIIESCYSVLNDKKHFTAGSFLSWAILPELNDGLPIQKMLYHVVLDDSDGSSIQIKLEELGFTLYA